MLVTWPYLWENPMMRLVEVVRFMSDNPTQLAVLFNGETFRADDIPQRYLPFMLTATLTEPTWFLFPFGVAAGFFKFFKDKENRNLFLSLTLTLSWFIILPGYVLLRQPAVYDGLRHFLFILPPVFIFTGFAFEWLINRVILVNWLRAGVVVLILLPGWIGIVQLHPYEYAYYSSYVGGTSGAFRRYETDYWLTCYKEAVEAMDQRVHNRSRLFVRREAYIASYYASEIIDIRELRGANDEVESGDYVLVNTRTNEDRSTFRDAPPVIQISRGDAIFCVVKQIP